MRKSFKSFGAVVGVDDSRQSLHYLRRAYLRPTPTASVFCLVTLCLSGVLISPTSVQAREVLAAVPTTREPAIFDAITKNDAKAVAQILKDDPSQAKATNLSGNKALSVAIPTGNVEVIRLLLDAKADVNAPDLDGRTPLTTVLSYNSPPLVALLLDYGANPDAADREGISPLVRAVLNTNQDIAEALLRKGAKVNIQNRRGETALELAVQYNRPGLVTLLLENNASVESRTAQGFTPLHTAAQRGNVEIARALLQKGANVNAVTLLGDTPLHFAAQNLSALTNVLLQAGADATRRNARGDLPLHLALRRLDPENPLTQLSDFTNIPGFSSYAFGDRISSVAFRRGSVAFATSNPQPRPDESAETALAALIEKSDVNARDRLGLSPLLMAVMARDPEVRDFIKARGPRMDSTTQLFDAVAGGDTATVEKLLGVKPFLAYFRLPDGTTPLHVAALWGARGAAETLLKKGADPNAHDANGLTPLHECLLRATGLYARRGRAMTKLLLEHGAEVNSRDIMDNTPLLCVVRTGEVELLTQLLNAKADLNASNTDGRTPLHLVSGLPAGTDSEVVALLLAKGASVDLRDREGNTPLMKAVEARRPELVQALLTKGAQVNLSDYGGQTALGKLSNSLYGDAPALVSVLEALLKAGADPNLTSAYESLLVRAVQSNNKNVVSLLLQYKADPNPPSSSNYTPLMAAINNGNLDIVTLLVNSGANVLARSNSGETPLLLAQRRENKDIANFLQAKINAPKSKE